jgi:hypothetical protein
MCTVSWFHTADGYQLFCNRDERHTRLPATPPQAAEQRGVRVLAPRDGDHGGTWLAVNQFGLSLCLLNRTAARPPNAPATYTSRGLLLLELADTRAVAHLPARLSQATLARFRPFTLLALAPQTPAQVWQWTGTTLESATAGAIPLPLSSSSYAPAQVVAARQNHFRNVVKRLDEPTLRRFHASHAPAASAYSTCMHRADASTVSFSHLQVAAGTLQFFYHPAAPCTLPAKLTGLTMTWSGGLA